MLIAALVILGVDMLFGFKRGLGRTVARLVTMVFSAIAAYFAAKGLCRAFGDTALAYVQKILQSNETIASFFTDNPDALASLGVLAEALISPLLFFICYLILKFVTFFVYAIVCGVFGIGKKKNRTFVSRLTGMAVGVAAGFVGILVLVIPVCGYSDFVNDTVASMQENEIVETAQFSEYSEAYLEPIEKTPVCSTLYQTVGAPLFEGLTTGDLNGEKVVLKSETLTLLDVVGDAKTLAGKDISAYGEAESVAIRQVASGMGDSVILTHVGSAALKDLSVKWMSGQPFFGVARPTINENADILINGILTMFSTSDAQNIEGDLTAFADVFAVCVKYNVFSCFSGSNDDMLNCLTNGFLPEVQAIIKSSPRMTPIYSALSDIGMRYMISQLGVPEQYAEMYPQLMEDMTGAVRSLYDEEGNVDKEAFTENISTVLESNGVNVSSSAVDLIADGIAENFTKEEIDSMNDEEVVDALIERFGSAEAALAAAQKFQSGEIPTP